MVPLPSKKESVLLEVLVVIGKASFCDVYGAGVSHMQAENNARTSASQDTIREN